MSAFGTQRKHKHHKAGLRPGKKIAVVILGLGVLGGLYVALWKPRPSSPSRSTMEREVPASRGRPLPLFYESEQAAEPLPRTLSPAYFRNPYVAEAYRVAQRIPGVLAQQPCYCQCDKVGHRSLLDCYVSTHGAG